MNKIVWLLCCLMSLFRLLPLAEAVSGGYRSDDLKLSKYIVSLRRFPEAFFGSNHICGGVIIGKKLVATAATCLTKFSDYQQFRRGVHVVAGSENIFKPVCGKTRIYNVTKVKRHSDYKELSYNVGLLETESEFVFDGEYMAELELTHEKPKPGTTCTTLGWGRIFEGGPIVAELIYIDLQILEDEKCNTKRVKMDDSILCATDKDFERDICQGDGGGPLVCNGKLAGIVTFSFTCAKPGNYRYFANVNHLRDWIAENNCNALTFDVKRFVLMEVLVIVTGVISLK